MSLSNAHLGDEEGPEDVVAFPIADDHRLDLQSRLAGNFQALLFHREVGSPVLWSQPPPRNANNMLHTAM